MGKTESYQQVPVTHSPFGGSLVQKGLAENVRRQIKPADYGLQHALSDVLTFVKCNRITLGAAINIRMVNHPLRPFPAFGVKHKSCIVLMQDAKYLLRL